MSTRTTSLTHDNPRQQIDPARDCPINGVAGLPRSTRQQTNGSSGHSASYLTEAVASGRENYYTGAVTAGEPPGRWCGQGAVLLGLAGGWWARAGLAGPAGSWCSRRPSLSDPVSLPGPLLVLEMLPMTPNTN